LRNSTASSRAIPRPTPAPARCAMPGRRRAFWSNPQTAVSPAERRNTYVRSARRSLRSIDILPPPLISCVLGHLDTQRYLDTPSIVLGLLSESRTITDYFMPASLALSHVLLDPHE
jgi:hypothetical protein